MEGLILYMAGALATWRLAKATTEEEGPFSSFVWVRDRSPQVGRWGWVGRGLDCLWCTSFWGGPVLAALLYGVSVKSILIGWSWSAVAVLFEAVVSIALLEIAKRQSQ